MKKFFMIFFVTSIPFGVFMGIFTWNLKAGIYAGLIFGILMALTLGVINFFATKIHGGGKNTSVKQAHEIELQLPFNEAYEKCIESIRYIPGGKVTGENYAEGTILGKTGVNIWTWGDKLALHVEKINEETSKVHVQSRPAVATTVVDYGKNLKNIKTISNYLQKFSR